uniref:ANK_REP_REGION domain-containing protein n=1 Tax=Macrostomum lignano TaxID=282301 RepID=A0A1I8FWK4_9PLAT
VRSAAPGYQSFRTMENQAEADQVASDYDDSDEDEISADPSEELLLYASKKKFETALDFITISRTPEFRYPGLQTPGLKLLEFQDDHLRTAAHYAAKHRDGESLLTEIVKQFGPNCLTTPDEDKITPLQLSARYHSAESWDQNFTELIKSQKSFSLLRLKDSNGDTCAHWAAKNSVYPKTILKINEKSSTMCWKWKNNRNETVLHKVLEHCRDEGVLQEIIDGIKNASDLLTDKDVDGNELALLDLAAFFDRDEILPELILTRQFELIPCCLSLLIQLGPEINRMRAKAKGKHEQLLQLQKKVTNIAMNALNELFVNASPSELKLLFRYIKGKMTIAGGSNQENNKEGSKNCSGPQFPYAVSVDDSGAGDSGATDSGATDSERRSDNDQVNGANWWQDKSLYPPDYNRFLEFQAIQFRRCRSRLLRDT